MHRSVRYWITGVVAVCILVLAACGNPSEPMPIVDSGPELSLGVSTEDSSWFNTETMTAPAEQEVSLTFHNDSGLLRHNWVLVDGGDDVATAVNAAGIEAGPAAEYLPESEQLVVATQLLDPGESATVTFTLPPGTYTFICTFPGHYDQGMKGTLTVE
ncbi:MAG: auracyanin [Chloroflexi bacterium AL-W]|nr:auracyanin [Chloroflexi bacterium AL-N1]NOK68289.1 auracyanin [Chloroflexi bacterium AL-N10]NOK73935.1 auracyanin [Chloroflexi bacterium AL-N5]NOK82903.1 auracyanin [Chloroflexi bacterium AL-W]NOK90425.1 auracyanin [Chloroflexi bacterium AL-N15]